MKRSVRISVSDLQSFHACPRSWYWYRKYGGPKLPEIPLFLGSGVHAGLEGYYRNNRSAEKGLEAFEVWQTRSVRSIAEHLGSYWTISRDPFENAVNLARKMLANFFEYDEVEKPELLQGEIVSVETKLEHEILPGVTIVMKSDLVLRDGRGHLWLVDHKTYSREPDAQALDIDDQLTAYAYLQTVLTDEMPYGILHNVLFKAVPEPPAMLTRGGFSKAKSQATTYAMYMKALEESGLDQEPYQDILMTLKASGWSTYFQQFSTMRNFEELLSFETRLMAKVFDILRALQAPDVWAFPNPNPFQCKSCPFRTACKSANDGGDFEAILKQNFTTKSLY